MFEMDLIDAVRRYPCIYDTNMDRTALILKMAWKVVAREVGEDVQVCRSRWRSLRDRYVKELRSDPHQISIWPFKEKMDFLQDFLSPKFSTREEIALQTENSSTTMDIEEEQKHEQIVCTAGEGAHQDVNLLFEDVYVAEGIYGQKEEYLGQTPVENVNKISCNKIDYEVENNDGVIIQASRKRTLNDSHGESNNLINPIKKKKKLFLGDFMGPQKDNSLRKQHRINSCTNYDSLVGTLNEYIRNRIGQDQTENEDFFKVLDTYLMKLPENVQDELMAKILLKVLNKSNEE